MTKLEGKRVAILVENGFEEVEMTEPRKALDEAGAKTVLISPQSGVVKSWSTKDWGKTYQIDLELKQAKPEDYDALVLPGGVMNPDKLRGLPEAIAFIASFVKAGKPIAAICHGPWTLIDAGAVKGKTMTSWPTLKTDLVNAGARWVDEECVESENLVTSRKPDDLPAFNRTMLARFAKGTTPAAG